MTELPETTDVLIARAGPTGLALAATLCAADVECPVIDALDEGGNYSRAAGTLPRSLEMLQRLKVGERLADAGNHPRRIRIFPGDRDRNIATLRLDRLDTPFPYAVLLPQHSTEAILLSRPRELGGSVHRPLRLTGLEQTAKEAAAAVKDADGQERTVRARYVVGADDASPARNTRPSRNPAATRWWMAVCESCPTSSNRVSAAAPAPARAAGIATQRTAWKGAVRDPALPVSALPPVNRKMIYRLSRLVDR